MSENSLAIFTKAAQMLAEADTIQKCQELKDLALTAMDWAKRRDKGKEAIQLARSYALEAERKMGEMLLQTERAKGGQPYQESTSTQGLPVDLVPLGDQVDDPIPELPTLKELGLTKKESSKAQFLAELPDEDFEQIKAGDKTVTEVRREIKRAEVKEAAKLPSDKYRVIYADPPWKYGDQLTEDYGAAKFHYPSMSIAELCAMPVSDMCEDNAVLFIWVTSPLLEECFEVIAAWGFKYKASFVWDKIKHNMGHYNSVRHELLLICTRGSCLPDSKTLVDSVQSLERTGHSEKPEEFRVIIDSLYENGRRIELFARRQTPGWDAWGNQFPGE